MHIITPESAPLPTLVQLLVYSSTAFFICHFNLCYPFVFTAVCWWLAAASRAPVSAALQTLSNDPLDRQRSQKDSSVKLA